MANRLSPEKARAIAAEYITNGYNRVDALKTVGYKPSYAEHIGLKLFDNITVKNEIALMQARTELKTGITLDFIQTQHIAEYNKLKDTRDKAIAFQHLQAAGKTIGAYADTLNINDDKALEIDLARRQLLKRIASHTIASTLLEDIHATEPEASPDAAIGRSEAKNGLIATPVTPQGGGVDEYDTLPSHIFPKPAFTTSVVQKGCDGI